VSFPKNPTNEFENPAKLGKIGTLGSLGSNFSSLRILMTEIKIFSGIRSQKKMLLKNLLENLFQAVQRK